MALLGTTNNITKGQVLRYMLTPQIVPRLNDFYKSGFGYLAYLIALVYRAVNILPAGHRVFSPNLRNSLSIRMVLGAAAAELKFSRHHIDQIIIYFAVLAGIVILAAQFFMTLAFLMLNPAMAAGAMPTTYAGFFATPNYAQDIAYNLLYSVFGVRDIFMPGLTPAGADGDGRRPFHVALHALFQLYSVGLLVVAVIVVCYFVFAIVVETAQTGVPFGKRYNHVWTPIRLVFGLGLLIPVGLGLNSAQWITLYAAKFGSDFATRGWIIFNDVMTESYLSNPLERVGIPQAPNPVNLMAFLTLVGGCKFGYDQGAWGVGSGKTIEGYLVRGSAESPEAVLLSAFQRDYRGAKEFFNGGDIVIRFGEYAPDDHAGKPNNVFPYCGEVVVFSGDSNEPGAELMQALNFYIIYYFFYGARGDFQTGLRGENFMRRHSTLNNIKDPNTPSVSIEYRESVMETARGLYDEFIPIAVVEQANSPTWEKDLEGVGALGWGGAGIWYNKIAQLNGSLVNSTMNVPQVTLYPDVMEKVKKEQLQQNTFAPKWWKLSLSDGREIQLDETDKPLALGMSEIIDFWAKEDTRQDALGNQTKTTSNAFIDGINLIFGTRGLFNMCANTDVHPLAQLSTLGKGLVEATIRNIAGALGFGLLSTIQIPFLGVAGDAASKFLLSIATITLTIGFVLFYVLPFMPFLYFFFAVGGWIKGLFAAMVGLPLWALAHLRIDGEGLPGDAAISGYYLIFEIFLRPILIIFGLLASVVIFSAMVKVLNEIFSLVVSNVSGHDPNNAAGCGTGGLGSGGGEPGTIAYYRGPVDELFFTVIYAIIVYMIGMSCFKLIDLIPNQILRYMNASVQTFNDGASDPAQGLMGYTTIGVSQLGQKAINVGADGASAITNALKGAAEAGSKQSGPSP